MGDVDPKVIKKTQDTLGKIINKPPLTDKLLTKPPFRFLHDIFASVIKTTGFMKGLFNDDEMIPDNIKDKENKIKFLQKAIDLVTLVVMRPIAAKPSKIVAGLDADKTNEFLQALAEAINKKVDNADYVQRVLKDKGDNGLEKVDKKEEKKKEEKSFKRAEKESDERVDRGKKGDREKSEDRKSSKNKDNNDEQDKNEDKKGIKSKEKGGGDKGDREARSSNRDKKDAKNDDKKGSKSHKEKSSERSEKDSKPHQSLETDASDKITKNRKRDRSENSGDNKENDGEKKIENGAKETEIDKDSPLRMARPASAKGSRRRAAHSDSDEESGEDASKEPAIGKRENEIKASSKSTISDDSKKRDGTASKRENETSSKRDKMTIKKESKSESSTRASSSANQKRIGTAKAPPPPITKQADKIVDDASRDSISHVIVDKKGGGDDSDDDQFIAKEDNTIDTHDELIQNKPENDDEGMRDEHGQLVRKLLTSKKDFDATNQHQKKAIIEDRASEATRRKEREIMQKENDKLRATIQLLTRGVNPMGKLLDFVQEDLDAMQKEMEMWKKENKENEVALRRENNITEQALIPLRAQLKEYDQALYDQLDLISTLKANIIHNTEKIERMLHSVSNS